MFVKSTKIKVFPTAWRGEGINPEATLNTEENLTGIINRLSRTKGYTSYVVDWNSSTGKLVFCINGYLFELAEANTHGYPLYAGIKLINDDGGIADFSNKTLSNLVENNVSVLDRVETEGVEAEFCGVLFTNDESDLSGFDSNCKLHLFDTNGYIPEESWGVLDTTQVLNTSVAGSQKKPIKRLFSTDLLETPTISAYSGANINFYGSSFILHGDMFPSSNNTWDLGKSGAGFRSIYGNNINLASTLTMYGLENYEVFHMKQSGALDTRYIDIEFGSRAGSIHFTASDSYTCIIASLGGFYSFRTSSTYSVYASKNMNLTTEKGFYISGYGGVWLTASSNPVCITSPMSQGIILAPMSSQYVTRIVTNSATSDYPTIVLPSQSGLLALNDDSYVVDPHSNDIVISHTTEDKVHGATKLYGVGVYNATGNPYDPYWVVDYYPQNAGSKGAPVHFIDGEPVQCGRVTTRGATYTANTLKNNNIVALVDSNSYTSSSIKNVKSDVSATVLVRRLAERVTFDIHIKASTGWAETSISTSSWVRINVSELVKRLADPVVRVDPYSVVNGDNVVATGNFTVPYSNSGSYTNVQIYKDGDTTYVYFTTYNLGYPDGLCAHIEVGVKDNGENPY